MLVLFDIDHTLLDSGGAGLAALRQTLAELHGIADPNSIELDLAGSTDRSVFDDFAAVHRFEADEHAWLNFCQHYTKALAASLPQHHGHLMPGVPELLQTLSADPAVTLALLTGNIRSGAELKLKHFGLSQFFDFEISAFGGDAPNRNSLGPIALARASAQFGQTVNPRTARIIGDTPRDVACAQVADIPCLAVATGSATVAQLKAAGADAVFTTLADTAAVIEALSQLG